MNTVPGKEVGVNFASTFIPETQQSNGLTKGASYVFQGLCH